MVTTLGNRYQVTHEVWSLKLGVDGKPVRDSRGRYIKDSPLSRSQTYHNEVQSIMVGYEVAYISHEISTKPVDNIEFEYDSGASSIYKATSYENDGSSYSTTWTAEWVNEVAGDSQTVNQLNLTHVGSGASTANIITFATDEGLAIEVPRYTSLTVTWMHTWTRDDNITDDLLDSIRDKFTGAETHSEPFVWVQFSDTTPGETYDVEAELTIAAGGSTSDDYVEFRATAQNGDGADHVVTRLRGRLNTIEDVMTYGAVGTISPSVSWPEGETNACRIIIRWTVSGSVAESAIVTDEVTVT